MDPPLPRLTSSSWMLKKEQPIRLSGEWGRCYLLRSFLSTQWALLEYWWKYPIRLSRYTFDPFCSFQGCSHPRCPARILKTNTLLVKGAAAFGNGIHGSSSCGSFFLSINESYLDPSPSSMFHILCVSLSANVSFGIWMSSSGPSSPYIRRQPWESKLTLTVYHMRDVDF